MGMWFYVLRIPIKLQNFWNNSKFVVCLSECTSKAIKVTVLVDDYKIVMRDMLGFPPRLNVSLATMQEVTKHLLPIHPDVTFNCDRKNSKAPGLNNIYPEVLKAIIADMPKYVLCEFMVLHAEQFSQRIGK